MLIIVYSSSSSLRLRVHPALTGTSSQAVKVTGLISTAAWGQGRSSPDRQFYYVNGRPVDFPVVAKAVNEVYRSFNTHQLPLVILDFSVPRGTAAYYSCRSGPYIDGNKIVSISTSVPTKGRSSYIAKLSWSKRSRYGFDLSR